MIYLSNKTKFLTGPVRKVFSNGAGFTLSELLIAAFVLIFVLIILLAAIVGYITTTKTISDLAIASNHARMVIEKMRQTAVGDNWLSDLINTNWTVWAGNNGCNTLEDEEVLVAYPNPSGEPLEATVTLSWVDLGRYREFELTTLFYRR